MNHVEQAFHFRADSEGNKRPSVVVNNLPQVDVSDLIEALNDEDTRVHELILDGVNSVIQAAARKQIDDGAEELDLDKLTLEFLAYVPKNTRGIPKEVWEAFKLDYVEVMVNQIGKEPEKAEKAAALLAAKFNTVKVNKEVIAILVGLLNDWFAVTNKGEEFAAVYEYLSNRAEALMADTSTNLTEFL